MVIFSKITIKMARGAKWSKGAILYVLLSLPK
jgi:hypothetical protein